MAQYANCAQSGVAPRSRRERLSSPASRPPPPLRAAGDILTMLRKACGRGTALIVDDVELERRNIAAPEARERAGAARCRRRVRGRRPRNAQGALSRRGQIDRCLYPEGGPSNRRLQLYPNLPLGPTKVATWRHVCPRAPVVNMIRHFPPCPEEELELLRVARLRGEIARRDGCRSSAQRPPSYAYLLMTTHGPASGAKRPTQCATSLRRPFKCETAAKAESLRAVGRADPRMRAGRVCFWFVYFIR